MMPAYGGGELLREAAMVREIGGGHSQHGPL